MFFPQILTAPGYNYDVQSMHTYIASRTLTWAQARPLEHGPEPRAAGPSMGPDLDWAWDQAQDSPGLGPRGRAQRM